MTSSVLGTTWLALVAAATLAVQGQSAAPGQRSSAAPRPKRAVIVTGENSYNGHVWKDTSAELKNILDAGKDFQEVVIQSDPNFIASDEFGTYELSVPPSSISAIRTRWRRRSSVEADLLKFLGQPEARDGALGERRVSFLARVREHRRAGTVKRARSPGIVHRQIVNPNHPITKDMKDYETDDELFWDTKSAIAPSPGCGGDLESALRRFPDGARTAIQPGTRVQHDDGPRREGVEGARDRRPDQTRHGMGCGHTQMAIAPPSGAGAWFRDVCGGIESPGTQAIVQPERVRLFERPRFVPVVHFDALDHPQAGRAPTCRAMDERGLVLRLRHGGHETGDEIGRRRLNVERHVLEIDACGLRSGRLFLDVSALLSRLAKVDDGREAHPLQLGDGLGFRRAAAHAIVVSRRAKFEMPSTLSCVTLEVCGVCP